MKWIIAALVIIVLVVAGIGIGIEASLNQNVSIKQVSENNEPLPLVNGVYKLSTSNITTIVVSFTGSFNINYVSNVFYGAYYTNLTPLHHVIGNTIEFTILAFTPFIFTLGFTLHYTVVGLFGLTNTHFKAFKIEIT